MSIGLVLTIEYIGIQISSVSLLTNKDDKIF